MNLQTKLKKYVFMFQKHYMRFGTRAEKYDFIISECSRVTIVFVFTFARDSRAIICRRITTFFISLKSSNIAYHLKKKIITKIITYTIFIQLSNKSCAYIRIHEYIFFIKHQPQQKIVSRHETVRTTKMSSPS